MKGKKTTTKKTSTKTSKKKTKTAAKKSSTKKKTSKKAASKKKPASKKKFTKKQTKKKTSKKTAAASKSSKSPAKKGASPATSNGRAAAGESKSASSKKGKARSVAEVASSAAADDKGYVFINGRRVRMISTQGLAPAKKLRAAAAVTPSAAKDEPPRLTKTQLTRKELKHFRELLLIKRAELFGDLSAMEAEALRSSGGNISHMPIHMADIGTDTYDQDFMLGLAETERRQLREIDEALERIQNGTYGICQMTGQEIPKARLEAKPWAKYTIEAARLMESQTRS